MKPENLEDGAIIVVGNKQVQVLDLVVESSTVEVKKSTILSSFPPRKRPKISIDISPEALTMPEPNADHQVNKFL